MTIENKRKIIEYIPKLNDKFQDSITFNEKTDNCIHYELQYPFGVVIYFDKRTEKILYNFLVYDKQNKTWCFPNEFEMDGETYFLYEMDDLLESTLSWLDDNCIKNNEDSYTQFKY